jgi:glycosyltransferase involved in cell wall biosynthesis
MGTAESLTGPATGLEDPPPRAGDPSFCIVLPVYNEAPCLDRGVCAIARYLAGLNRRTGIVAVDDGSEDASYAILEQLCKTLPDLHLYRHARNLGYGAANRTACSAALKLGFDYALVMDADGTQSTEFIGAFLEPMRQGTDFIKATRYAKGGRVEGVHWKRRLISSVGNRLARWCMRVPLTDFTNGFRAIRTDLWSRLHTTERNFAVLVEEVCLARNLGASFAEVPYVLTARSDEGSTSKFVYSWQAYMRYARLLIKS